MPLVYPLQRFGRFQLGLGLTTRLLHEKFGADFGERYHKDVEHRLRMTMELDRAVFDAFGNIGLGYREPFPRITIEPFGHRFMPALYGCEVAFEAGGDPWAKARPLRAEEIESLEPWTRERFEQAAPVREVVAQTRYIQKHYRIRPITDPDAFNPHYRHLSSLQNLGAVITTAVSVYGDEMLLAYVTSPGTVRKLYAHMTQLMLIGLRYFAELDGAPPPVVFVGNCSVSMISPAHYAEFNFPCDQAIARHAREIGARFMMHQDSAVTPHIEQYARLDGLGEIDFGQDTDFERAAQLLPGARGSCLIFPSWVKAQSPDAIRAELTRLMRIGRRYPSFQFALWEIDSYLAGGKIFEFYEIFRQCAEAP
ncbi:MAG: hypothetical protein HY360_20495 [Verrucomicrobia bacterium]|nr:hypothetical protein [Verrucomicrobiota bacterium]